MAIGERVTERLKALGMSQAELARRVGMAQSSINALINRNKVGSKHIHKIARELQTTPAFLYEETDDSQSESPDYHLTGEEVQLLEKLRALSDDDRKMVMSLTKKLSGRETAE